MPKKHSSKAFTLIELLVVVAVIGLLATISVLALQNARAKGRDAKRLSDVKQIQTALELYYNSAGRYPTAIEFASGAITHYSTSTGTTTFMVAIPAAPYPADGSCVNALNNYEYAPAADGSSYEINFCIGRPITDIPEGPKSITPVGIIERIVAVDVEGNVYPAERMPDGLIWTTKNLQTTKYRDGSSIMTGLSSADWAAQNGTAGKDGAYIVYTGFDIGVYGGLYNWYAVTNPKGLCPSGWHAPTVDELNGLINAAGGASFAGGKLKSRRTAPDDHPRWTYNAGTTGTDDYGFSMEAGGIVNQTGGIGQLGNLGRVWTSSTYLSDTTKAYATPFWYDNLTIGANTYFPKVAGYSVRCVKDY